MKQCPGFVSKLYSRETVGMKYKLIIAEVGD
jgi:hypothetical protein